MFVISITENLNHIEIDISRIACGKMLYSIDINIIVDNNNTIVIYLLQGIIHEHRQVSLFTRTIYSPIVALKLT